MPIQVLLMGDSAGNADWIEDSLAHFPGGERFDVIHTTTLPEAQALFASQDLPVVLADVSSSVTDVNARCDWLQGIAKTTALVLLTNPGDERLALSLIQAGAQDYLVKDRLEPAALLRSLTFAAERSRLQGELMAAQRRQERLATHDILTDLPNRTLYRDRLSVGIRLAKRQSQKLAVLLIDIDHFKSINDRFGHDMGDRVLLEMGARLTNCLRRSDTAARIGEDEFGGVLMNIRCEKDADDVAQKIIHAFAEPLYLQDQTLLPSVSIGIAVYPKDGEDETTLIKHADAALQNAKQQGRARFCHYNAEVHAQKLKRLALELDLRSAMERQEFSIHYQPIIGLDDGGIVAAEALLRWQHPHYGLVSPGDFIQLAESSGLILPLGQWILETVCQQNKAWQEQGMTPIRVAVNLSATQFVGQDYLVEAVQNALNKSGLEARWLELEITESAAMNDPDATIAILTALRKLGIRVAIDDFGTGYSSLSYLQRFPVDTLKIDRDFVRDVTTNPESAAITKTILALAHALKLETVAEGVENAEQQAFLHNFKCDFVQGFLYSKPIPEEKFSVCLQKHCTQLAEEEQEKVDIAPLRTDIQALLNATQQLPSMPQTARQLLNLSRRQDANVKELCHIVRSDPAVTAQILRYANAPFFGYRGKIESIEQAVIRVLGYDGAMGIALGISALGALKMPGHVAGLCERFWQHAVYSAALAQGFASLKGARFRVKPGMAYLTGLLHDMGFLFVASHFPEMCESLYDNFSHDTEDDIRQQEMALLGISHTEVGAKLLRNWAVPEETIIAAQEHHDANYQGEYADYVMLVQLADVLLTENTEQVVLLTCLQRLREAGLDFSLEEVEEVFEQVMAGQEGLDAMARQLVA
jgi:diguanylate cyclase (GGDEF)-like protein